MYFEKKNVTGTEGERERERKRKMPHRYGYIFVAGGGSDGRPEVDEESRRLDELVLLNF